MIFPRFRKLSRWGLRTALGVMGLGVTGLVQAGGIGNLVFRDLNENRVFDNSGDGRVVGAHLQLFLEGKIPGTDPPLAVTTTDGSGRYLFDGLADGRYFVLIPNTDFTVGGVLEGTRSVLGTLGGPKRDDNGGENGLDSPQPTVQGVRSAVVVLTAGQAPVSYEGDQETGDDNDSDDATDEDTDLTIDFGFAPLTSQAGDFVWRDDNRNGLQDAGEPGLLGVSVKLFTATGVLEKQTLTAEDGAYRFSGMASGDYYIEFPLRISTLKLTLPDQGNNDALDSDGVVATGRSPVFTLAPMGSVMNIDAGYVVDYPKVGDFVFDDANQNGIRDLGEAGLNGVTVELYTSARVFVASAFSANGGFYSFLDVTPGTYFLKFPRSITGGAVLTEADVGLDDTVDSDANATTGETSNFTVISGRDDLTRDAGYRSPPAGIRGLAWLDLNNNGLREATEPALDGVSVSLLDAATGLAEYNTITVGGGSYEFTNVASRAWKVEFSRFAGLNQRYRLTTQDVGTDDTIDSDPDPNTGKTISVVPAVGATVLLDAGYREVLLGIGNAVFRDSDGNSTFSSGEGVGGVELQLFAAGSDPLTSAALSITSTLSSGIYSFLNRTPGQYFVYIPASQFAPGKPLAGTVSVTGNGGDDGADDEIGENGIDAIYPVTAGIRSNVVTLSSGNEPLSGTGTEKGQDNTSDGVADDGNVDLTLDFGFKTGITLGNLVFSDRNNDNRYTSGEGVEGVAVELYSGTTRPGVDPAVARVTTNAGGFYYFVGIMPGRYTVHLPASNFQSGQPLVGQRSLTGNGTSTLLDDDADENGIDNANPSVSGISAPAFTLVQNALPVTAQGETGAGSTYDDADDANGILTVDFGMLPKLPVNYAAWQQRFLPSGANGATQDADGDGFSNAFEYLYQLPPSGSVAGVSPLTLTANPTTGKLSATLVFNPSAADTAPVLTGRADLRDGVGAWQAITTITPVDVILTDDRVQRTWSDLEQVPSLSGGTGFIRVSASLDTNGDNVPDFSFHTSVLGWRDRSHLVGNSTSGTAFLRPSLFRGTVDNVSGGTLTLTTSTGGGDLASLFTVAGSFYAEITSGPLVGHRFEIDEAASGGSNLKLETANGLNTMALPDLTAASLAVRRHWTLNALYPPSQFYGTANSATADQILTYPRPSFVTYFLFVQGSFVRWVKSDDNSLGDAGDLVIPPGTGLFVNRRNAALTVLELGEVRSHAMARILTAGYTLQTSGWPLPSSPAAAGLLQSDGLSGSTNPALADSLQTWSGDAGSVPKAFRSFFLLHAPLPYRYWADKSDASLVNRNNENILLPGRAFFLQLRATVPDARQPCPWTP